MDLTIQLQGFKELAEELRTFAPRIAKNALQAAARAGAAQVRDEARRVAPVYTGSPEHGHPPPGTLKKAIYSGIWRSRSRPESAVAFVSVRQGGKSKHDAYYARWVEFGHWTRGKGVKAGVHQRALKGGWIARTGAHWVPAKPFLRPAFESKKLAAIEAIRTKLLQRIVDEAAATAARVGRAR